jgi:hypothetical protein
MDFDPSAYRQHLTHPVINAKRGKPVWFHALGRPLVTEAQYHAGRGG